MSWSDSDGAPAGAGDAAPAELAAEWIGRVLDGRYRLLGLIGTGGMGSVMSAEHVTTRRRFAVKLLHADLAKNYETRQRFEREAIAIGRIQHPNCVDVSDFGTLEDGSMFLVMEYLDGRSLAELIEQEGPIAPVRALRIARHVVRGLGHAHSAGIIHRDIKPENVVLTDRHGDPDFAKVLDFGIAKLLGEETDHGAVRLTRAGIAFGTPLYISPEQATGGAVDGRSDLYGATVVLFEMLAGKPPFDSDDNLQLLALHATHPPPTVAALAPEGTEVPAEVEALVARGLAKRPAERLVDAATYEAAITAAIAAIAPGEPDLDPGREFVSRPASKESTVPIVYGAPSVSQPIPRPALAPTIPPDAVLGAGGAAGVSVTGGSGVSVTGGSGVSVTGASGTIAAGEGGRAPSRRMLVAGAVAAAGILAISGWLVFGRDAGTASLSASALRTGAERLVAEGEAEAAAALLQAHHDVIEADPVGQIALGEVFTAWGRPKRALAAFERAIELDPRSADDPGLRAGLRDLMEHPATASEATELAIVKLSDAEARAHLLELASTHREFAMRRRARSLAEEHRLGDQIDRLASYSLDLAHRHRNFHCRHRREVVEKLRALGDPLAIPALEEAIERRDARGRPANSCLIDDARAAIAELEARR